MAQTKQIWTIQALLNWTINFFKQKGIESARLDAEVLLAHLLKKERIYLYVHFDEPMQEQELAVFREYVKRRAKHVPVAHIIGEKEFMGMKFKVTPDTLVPRPDTEILVENGIAELGRDNAAEIADIGTGSGAIILSMLADMPKAKGCAVDISAKALAVARENADSLGVSGRCEFSEGDLFAPLAGRVFDAVVSNPPYIPASDIAGLEDDVKKYEPLTALTDGGDGLSFYRRLFSEGRGFVKDGGMMAVEIGIHQSAQVRAIAEQSGWRDVKVVKDYAGIDRVVIAWKRN